MMDGVQGFRGCGMMDEVALRWCFRTGLHSYVPSVTRTGADLELPNNKGFRLRGLGVYGLG